MSAAFDAAYTAIRGFASVPAAEATFTMRDAR